MAINYFSAIGTDGGASGDLDDINHTNLNDGDIAIVIDATANKAYSYTYESSNSTAEAVPTIIKPDSNGGNGRWVLVAQVGTDTHTDNIQILTTSGNLVIKNQAGSTIATLADGQTLALLNGGAVNEFSTDGTMGGNSDTAVPTEKAMVTYVPTIVSSQLSGFAQRSQFKWKDGDEIYIEPGVYHHQGTTEQLVYWDLQITFQLQAAGSNAASDNYGADGWHYIYLDDSAIVTQASALLDADCFLNETTAPTWTVAKHGWYNGNDRCIFACYETGNVIIEFFHDGGDFMLFADSRTDKSTANITTDWSDEVTLTIPACCRKANVHFTYAYVDGNATAYWRTEGQSGTTGHLIGTSRGETQVSYSEYDTDVICSSNLKIDVKDDGVVANTMAVYTNGWHFPVGM